MRVYVHAKANLVCKKEYIRGCTAVIAMQPLFFTLEVGIGVNPQTTLNEGYVGSCQIGRKGLETESEGHYQMVVEVFDTGRGSGSSDRVGGIGVKLAVILHAYISYIKVAALATHTETEGEVLTGLVNGIGGVSAVVVIS